MGHLPGKKVTSCRSTTHMAAAVAKQRCIGNSFKRNCVLISMLERKMTKEPISFDKNICHPNNRDCQGITGRTAHQALRGKSSIVSAKRNPNTTSNLIGSLEQEPSSHGKLGHPPQSSFGCGLDHRIVAVPVITAPTMSFVSFCSPLSSTLRFAAQVN